MTRPTSPCQSVCRAMQTSTRLLSADVNVPMQKPVDDKNDTGMRARPSVCSAGFEMWARTKMATSAIL